MKEFTAFCQSLKDIIDNHPQLDIEGARKIVQQINEFLSSTYKCNFLGADNKQ